MPPDHLKLACFNLTYHASTVPITSFKFSPPEQPKIASYGPVTVATHSVRQQPMQSVYNSVCMQPP